MTKFATLLDPRKIVVTDTTCNLEERARAARRDFPLLVHDSNLRLWAPTMRIPSIHTRYLIGVAVSFAVLDLFFLDIVNACIASQTPCRAAFDVFDLDNTVSGHAFADYFPNTEDTMTSWDSHPIVGKWRDGELTQVLVGYPAMNDILSFLGSRHTVEGLIQRIRTGDRGIFED